ncbi:MAG: hypothetical protein GX442_15615 [Candidatus Riflebacteria bacterium]|nr:hypothetical protein [Candidatus Riflebacteria bacterium]
MGSMERQVLGLAAWPAQAGLLGLASVFRYSGEPGGWLTDWLGTPGPVDWRPALLDWPFLPLLVAAATIATWTILRRVRPGIAPAGPGRAGSLLVLAVFALSDGSGPTLLAAITGLWLCAFVGRRPGAGSETSRGQGPGGEGRAAGRPALMPETPALGGVEPGQRPEHPGQCGVQAVPPVSGGAASILAPGSERVGSPLTSASNGAPSPQVPVLAEAASFLGPPSTGTASPRGPASAEAASFLEPAPDRVGFPPVPSAAGEAALVTAVLAILLVAACLLGAWLHVPRGLTLAETLLLLGSVACGVASAFLPPSPSVVADLALPAWSTLLLAGSWWTATAAPPSLRLLVLLELSAAFVAGRYAAFWRQDPAPDPS